MKNYSMLEVETRKREEFIDITDLVQKKINDMGLKDGFLLLYVPHTTAGLLINENADPDVLKDISGYLSDLVPRDNGYLHSEGNSDAHIKATFVGISKHLIVREGKIVLGRWQGIFFGEFDGPRLRKVMMGFSEA